MGFLDMKDYTLGAKIYWWSCVILGGIAAGTALYATLLLPRSMLVQVAIGVAVAAAVGFFPVRLPGNKLALAGGDVFIFLILLLYGPGPAIVAAATEGFIAVFRLSKRWTSRIGSSAMIALAMMGCGTFLEVIRAQVVLDGSGVAVLLATLLVFSVLYFACITTLTSTLYALKSGS